MKNKLIHCSKCTRVLFILTSDLERNIDIVSKCPECKVLQRIIVKLKVKREVNIIRLDKPLG